MYQEGGGSHVPEDINLLKTLELLTNITKPKMWKFRMIFGRVFQE